MDLLTYLASNFLSLLGIGGYVIAGFFAFSGLWNMQASARRKENDAITAELIANLDKKVRQQADELDLMRQQTRDHTNERDTQVRKLQDDLKVLQGRNSLMEELIKGRDPAMQDIIKETPSMFEITRQNNIMSKANNEAITALTKTLNDFIDTLRPILFVTK